MGDFEGAKEILLEVSQEGNSEQKKEADELISQIETPNIHK
jgi:FimV-like protein